MAHAKLPNMEIVKKCSDCKLEKSLNNFAKATGRHSHGKHNICKPCVTIRTKNWAKENPEKNSIRARKCSLKKKYNMSLEEYDELLKSQNRICKICKGSKNRNDKFLCVDHDHATGKIRGLLCHDCNLLIGIAKENKSILENAIEYLTITKENK